MAWDVDDAALAEEDALRAADEEADADADALGAPRPPAVDAGAEEVSPAGEGVGAGVCPLRAVTARPAAAPAAIRPPTIHASITGRRDRRRGPFPPPDGGSRYASTG